LNGLECSGRYGWILDMKYQTCLPMGIQVHPLNYDDSNVYKGHHNHDTLAALFTFELFAIN